MFILILFVAFDLFVLCFWPHPDGTRFDFHLFFPLFVVFIEECLAK